mgnify:CR=1 FL=1
MNKITRYTLLLSLSCLTSVPTRAEVVSSGDKLLEIISNNQTGSTVSICRKTLMSTETPSLTERSKNTKSTATAAPASPSETAKA